ncbi:MAG: hypothetical protein P8182_14080, partial [Deltaproteobacteria bacterium]
PDVSERLKRDIEQLLGPGMTVTVEHVDKIDLEPSGKRLVIKSRLGPSRDSADTIPGRTAQDLRYAHGPRS